MKKEDVIAELTKRGIDHDPEASAKDLHDLLKTAEAADAEAGDKSGKEKKSEPKLLLSKGKFRLWEVADGFELRTDMEVLSAKVESFEDGKKLLFDMTRDVR